VSRDVVFDEKVFPFALMHPNAGAQLRAELSLLPDILLNPSNDFGDARDNGSMLSSVLANSSSGAGSASLPAGSIPTQDQGATHSYDAQDRGYFMCSPTGSNTRIEADCPATAGVSVGEAASGSASGQQQSSSAQGPTSPSLRAGSPSGSPADENLAL